MQPIAALAAPSHTRSPRPGCSRRLTWRPTHQAAHRNGQGKNYDKLGRGRGRAGGVVWPARGRGDRTLNFGSFTLTFYDDPWRYGPPGQPPTARSPGRPGGPRHPPTAQMSAAAAPRLSDNPGHDTVHRDDQMLMTVAFSKLRKPDPAEPPGPPAVAAGLSASASAAMPSAAWCLRLPSPTEAGTVGGGPKIFMVRV